MNIAIVWFGRFWQLMYQILKNEFNIFIVDNHYLDKIPAWACQTNFSQAFEECETIFLTLPINQFENFIAENKNIINKKNKQEKLLIDMLSIKLHPQQVCQKYISDFPVVHSHPMRWPDSVKINWSLKNLKMVYWSELQTTLTKYWQKYFLSKWLILENISPDEHDRLAAYSQWVVHFLWRVLEDFWLQETIIDTTWAKILNNLKNQTCNDSYQLFLDLQKYNPYTQKMRKEMEKSFEKIDSQIKN